MHPHAVADGKSVASVFSCSFSIASIMRFIKFLSVAGGSGEAPLSVREGRQSQSGTEIINLIELYSGFPGFSPTIPASTGTVLY